MRNSPQPSIRPASIRSSGTPSSACRKRNIPKMLTDAPTFDQWYTDVQDVNQKTQLVLNLVLNAAEAIGERSGRVAIRVRVREIADQAIHFHMTRVADDDRKIPALNE